MSRYMIYGNSGGIGEVIEELKNPKETFGGIKEVFHHLVTTRGNSFSIEDLYVKYYAYDERIEKDVFMITLGRRGHIDLIKKHGCPQFLCYMVSV